MASLGTPGSGRVSRHRAARAHEETKDTPLSNYDYPDEAPEKRKTQSESPATSASSTVKADSKRNVDVGAVPIVGSVTMELEHAIGFSGRTPRVLYFHPGGKEYVCAAGGSVAINDFRDPHKQCYLKGHDEALSCLALSHGGHLIASGQLGEHADVVVWDYKKRKQLYRLEEHYHGVTALAFSDDDRFLATAGMDRKIYVWDMKTGYIVSSVTAPTIACIEWGGRVRDAKGRPTTSYQFATAHTSPQEPLRLWSLDPATGDMTDDKLRAGHGERTVTCLGFTADGSYLYAGSATGDMNVFQIKHKILSNTFQCSSGGVTALAVLSSDDPTVDARDRRMGLGKSERVLLVGGGDGSLTKFVRMNNKEYVDTERVKLSGAVTSVSIHASGEELIAGTSMGALYRVKTQGLKRLLMAETHSSAVNQVCYPSGVSDRFVTCASDGSICVWDASDYSIRLRASGPRGLQPLSLQISRDCFIVGFDDGGIRAYDPASGEFLWELPNAHKDGVSCLAISPNQRFIVSGGEHGEVRVWELRSRSLVVNLKEHLVRVTGLATYGDNMHVLSCSRDRSFLCWDLQSEKRISSHRQHMGCINAIAITVDQNFVLTGGQERSITIWDLREAEPVRVIRPAHAGEVTCFAMANGGDVFATGGTDQTVKLWDFKTGKCLADGVGHSDNVSSLCFAADDKQLVSVGADHCCLVWNIYKLK